MTDEVEDFLAHYGVKGMKWGVRKAADGLKTAGKATGTAAVTVGIGARNSIKDAIRKHRDDRAVAKAERKANFDAARAKGYTAAMRNTDIQNLGNGGVRRVEKRIAGGERIGVARLKETGRSTALGLAVGTAILGAPVALAAANGAAGRIAFNVQANRGAEAARKLFADSKGLTSYSTVALSFDSAQGVWK